MPRKKRPRKLPNRYRIHNIDFATFSEGLIRNSKDMMMNSRYHGEVARKLVYEKKQFAILPAYVTGEENFPLCVFAVRVGFRHVEFTLN